MSLALIAQSYLFSGDEEDSDEEIFEEGNETVQDGLLVDLEEIRELVRQLHCLEVGKTHISQRQRSTPAKNTKIPDAMLSLRSNSGNAPKPKFKAEYRCPYCLIIFELADSLIKHLPSHSGYRGRFPNGNGNYNAEKTANRPSFIEIQRSSGRSIVKCSNCEQAFWKKWRAARHIRSHIRNRSCPCIICHSRY